MAPRHRERGTSTYVRPGVRAPGGGSSRTPNARRSGARGANPDRLERTRLGTFVVGL